MNGRTEFTHWAYLVPQWPLAKTPVGLSKRQTFFELNYVCTYLPLLRDDPSSRYIFAVVECSLARESG